MQPGKKLCIWHCVLLEKPFREPTISSCYNDLHGNVTRHFSSFWCLSASFVSLVIVKHVYRDEFLSVFSVHLLTFSCPCFSPPSDCFMRKWDWLHFFLCHFILRRLNKGLARWVSVCKCLLPSLAMIFWFLKPAWWKKKTTIVLISGLSPHHHHCMFIHTQN